MADQGKWFKLWVGARRDSHLGALSKEDFANWCLLGMYLKEQGCEGLTSHSAPAPALKKAMEIDDYEQLISVLKKFPNCVVEEKQNPAVTGVTIINVTWKNWQKYQGDFSGDRVRKFRANVTAKKRREEKRRDKKRKEVFIPPTPFEVSDYARSLDFDLDGEKFVSHYQARGWQFKNGSPMKDWKAAVVTWKKNGFKHGNGNEKPDWQ